MDESARSAILAGRQQSEGQENENCRDRLVNLPSADVYLLLRLDPGRGLWEVELDGGNFGIATYRLI
jgi:hypothetical protein